MLPQQKVRFDELKEASKPLVEFLNKYYSPMTSILITEGYIKIMTEDIGMPLKVRN